MSPKTLILKVPECIYECSFQEVTGIMFVLFYNHGSTGWELGVLSGSKIEPLRPLTDRERMKGEAALVIGNSRKLSAIH